MRFCPAWVLTALVCPRAASLCQGFADRLAQPWTGRAVPGLSQGWMVEHHYLLATGEEKTGTNCSPGGISAGCPVLGGSLRFWNRRIYTVLVVRLRKLRVTSSVDNAGTGRSISCGALAEILLTKQLLGQWSPLHREAVACRDTYCHLKEHLPSLALQIKHNRTVHSVSPCVCFLQWVFAMQAPCSSGDYL